MHPVGAAPNPFIFSRPVNGSAFLGQEPWVEAVARAMISGVPVIVSGPPRSGTSSLALAACAACEASVFPVILSGAGITGPDQFALRLEDALRKAEAGPGAAICAALERMPSLSFSPYPGVSLTLSSDHRPEPGRVLPRIVRAAGRHGRLPVLVIDDAHHLLAAPGMMAVLGEIAAGGERMGVVLAGRRGLLLRRLGAQGSAIGTGGAVMVSPAPLGQEAAVSFLCRRAAEAGGTITPVAAAEAVHYAGGHPFSVMRVAYALFEEGKRGPEKGPGAGEAAVRRVIRELAPVYDGICDGLSVHQVRVLSAIAAGEPHLYGKDVAGRCGLQRTAVSSSLRALSYRDLIVRDADGVRQCTDPLFAGWLTGAAAGEGGPVP